MEPNSRIALGQWLRRKATACLDISDGLVQDLGHILTASGCGADLNTQNLPLSDELLAHVSVSQARDYALSGERILSFALPYQRVLSTMHKPTQSPRVFLLQ